MPTRERRREASGGSEKTRRNARRYAEKRFEKVKTGWNRRKWYKVGTSRCDW